MDLWQMVLADHANILELCREVLWATGSGPNGRADLFAELDVELERLLRAEEGVLYPVLRRDDRTRNYMAELDQERREIRYRIDRLGAMSFVNSREWAAEFKELGSTINHYFTLEEGGVLTLARTTIEPHELDAMRRAYEREKIASIEARRWHMPYAMMPSRYGLSSGAVFGVLASVAAIGTAALLWNMSQQRSGGGYRPLRPTHRRPQPPFPLRRGMMDERLSRGRTSRQATSRPGTTSQEHAETERASSMNTGDVAEDNWFSSANPPNAPSGLATGLQPGGLSPGGGPGASVGSIGTGGGQTENRDTGSLKRDGR